MPDGPICERRRGVLQGLRPNCGRWAASILAWVPRQGETPASAFAPTSPLPSFFSSLSLISLRSLPCWYRLPAIPRVLPADSYDLTRKVGEEDMRIHLIDTAGQEEMRALRPKYIAKCDGFVLVYAVDDLQSFQELAVRALPPPFLFSLSLALPSFFLLPLPPAPHHILRTTLALSHPLYLPLPLSHSSSF